MTTSTPLPLLDADEGLLEKAIEEAIRSGLRELASSQAAQMRIEAMGQFSRDRTYEERAAADLLNRTLNTLVEMSRKYAAQKYSPYQWLWYLRRTPRVIFEGSIITTLAERLVIAELIATHTVGTADSLNCAEEGAKDFFFRFPIDSEVVKNVLLLSQLSHEVHQLQVLIRTCAKGASLKLSRDGNVNLIVSKRLKQALNLYDQRIIETPTRSRFPTFPDIARDLNPSKGFIGVGLDEEKHRTISEILGSTLVSPPSQTSDSLTLRTRYSIGKYELAEIVRILEQPVLKDELLWHKDVPVLFAFLDLMASLVVPPNARSHATLLGVLRLGYAVFERSSLEECYDKVGPELVDWCLQEIPSFADSIPKSGLELIQKLFAMKDSVETQLPGSGVMDATRGHICLNLVASSTRLLKLLKYPMSGGSVGNLQGDEFESSIQRMINKSLWYPNDPNIRECSDIECLKLAGARITDIDAIGMQDETILLVECKSIQLTQEYSAGDFQVIQRVRLKLEGDPLNDKKGYISKWKKNLKTIRENPKGDNYDFTGYKIIGVIVTPTIFYVPLEIAELMAAPGLRFYSSANELSSWLQA